MRNCGGADCTSSPQWLLNLALVRAALKDAARCSLATLYIDICLTPRHCIMEAAVFIGLFVLRRGDCKIVGCCRLLDPAVFVRQLPNDACIS